MFFYTSMSGSQQMQPTQPGMPNMKYIMYIIPFSLLIFFNNFASGLSLYYTISNILTIIIMLTVKNVILDEKKILLEIEENKKKPKTEGRFQRRLRKLQEAAEQAQKQQKQRNK
jgi:YidC/Oxa1 family membrane protein insertase